MWFSPPARMPLGLTIGAVTIGGRLHLVLRYRHRLFNQAAATRFADVYLRKLQAFTGPLAVAMNRPARRWAKYRRAA
jgi:hypothetical protein